MVRRMDKAGFAAAVKAAIVKSGEKRLSIAERSGVSEAAIRAIEAGHCPSIVRANVVLGALGRFVVVGDPDGEELGIAPAKARGRKRKAA